MALSRKEKDRLRRGLDIIDDAVDNFEDDIPAIQRRVLKRVNVIVKDLELDKEGKIKPSVENRRLLKKVSKEVMAMVMKDGNYKKAASKFVDKFDDVADANNRYFEFISGKI